jgi:DNA-directed RNA polymerase subunit RPC12/RpoP
MPEESDNLQYTCPNCSKECAIPAASAGQNVTCPNCNSEFFATPPEPPQEPPDAAIEEARPELALPEHLPFFKHGRRKILEQRFDQIIAAGGIDEKAQEELIALTAELKLDDSEWHKIRTEKFLEAFQPIKQRIETAMILTDDDMEAIHSLEKKYAAQLTLEGTAQMFRAIYVLETTHQLPPPLATNLMLEAKETAYYCTPTTWQQMRSQNRGYAGAGASLPTGIRGVRFRFGQYTPIRAEAITPLSTGTLYVTSKRLLFNGDSRNTSANLAKIVDGHLYSDCLKIDKSTGKPDYFSMSGDTGRYILALVGVLKTRLKT